MASLLSIWSSKIRSRLYLHLSTFGDMKDRTHQTYAVFPSEMQLRRRPSNRSRGVVVDATATVQILQSEVLREHKGKSHHHVDRAV